MLPQRILSSERALAKCTRKFLLPCMRHSVPQNIRLGVEKTVTYITPVFPLFLMYSFHMIVQETLRDKRFEAQRALVLWFFHSMFVH